MTSQLPDPLPTQILTFRCPAELEGALPPPVPASLGLPDWLKTMPSQSFNPVHSRQQDTVKRCPPFVDAMTSGFLIPLMCDLRFENGEITWDHELPPGGSVSFVRAPIGFHDESQVLGTPLFEADRFLIKFHNLSRGLCGAVHASLQPLRPAVHHADRHRRLRPLSRQLDQLSGALA
jgi:hypothetical protein